MNTGIVTVVIVAAFIFLRIRNNKGGGKFQNIDASTLRDMQKNGKIEIIDVRTPNETAAGKIKGAREINVMDMAFKQKVSNLDKDKTYVVYCRSGQRSRRACSIMAKAGFENLYNLDGGYNGWS